MMSTLASISIPISLSVARSIPLPFAMVRMALDLPVFFVVTVTDDRLIVSPFILTVFLPIIIMLSPGSRLISYYLIGPVQVGVISGRQHAC